MSNTISEEDLVRIFSYNERKEKRQNKLFHAFYYGLYFLIFATFVYIVINFDGVSTTVAFWYKGNFTTQTSAPAPTTVNDVSKNTQSTSVTPPAVTVPTDTTDSGGVNLTTPNVPTLQSEKYTTPVVANNHIAISVLDINAPVTFGVNNITTEVENNLKNGPIQINGTSLPGQTGNVYITGHSSNYVWIKSNYNSIFALLDKLVIGDFIYVNYNNTIYQYQVFKSEIVLPSDTSILKSTTDSRLTLVTCWPVGTSLKRIVILANQIHPDPANNTTPNTPANFQSLPSGR